MRKIGVIKEISVLQSFAITLVVLGHSVIAGVDFGPVISWLWHFIYSFHMPLFFTLSGYLFLYTGGTKANFRGFLINKTKRLLVPYVVLSTLAFFPKVLLSKIANRPIDFSVISYIKTIIYPVDNTIVFFWFAPTLFLIFVISPIFYHTLKNNKALVVLMTVLLVLLLKYNPVQIRLFNVSGALYNIIYFWLGCVLANYKHFTSRLFRNYYFFLIMLLITVLHNLVNPVYLFSHAVVAIVGTLMVFSFAYLYVGKGLSFDSINGYSYQIYLLSWFPQVFFDVVFRKLIGLNIFIVAFLMFISGLYLPVIVSKIIAKRLPKLKIIIGM